MAYGNWSASKWKNVWSNGYYAIDVMWSYRQDIAANKTQIREEQLRVRSLNTHYYFTYTACQVGIGDFGGDKYDEVRSVSLTGGGSATLNLTDRSAECAHNADGSWPKGKYAGWYKFNTVLTGNNVPNTGWKSFSVDNEIPKIARASSVSVSPTSGITIGDTLTINVSRATSSFKHTIRYSWMGNTGTIATEVGTSTTWDIPTSFANDLPDAVSGQCTIYCDTYNGSTLIGTKSVNVTISIPEGVDPSIDEVSIAEATSGISSQFGCYVQTKSTLHITVDASGNSGSSVKSCSISVDGVTYTGTDITTPALQKSGDIDIQVTITDSRGRTATQTDSIYVYPYSSPEITVANVTRATSSGVAEDDGTYALCQYDYRITDINGKNTHTFKIQRYSGTAWIDMVTYTDYEKTGSYLSAQTFSIDESFQFRFVVTDYFGSYAIERTMDVSFALINFGQNGHSMGIGMKSPNDGYFDLNLPSRIRQAMNLMGNLILGTTAKQVIGKFIYPVGSVIINTTGTNPGTQFGGTWEPFAPGRTLIGAGTGNDGSTSMTFTSGSTGGEYNHKLTVDELAKHHHLMWARNYEVQTKTSSSVAANAEKVINASTSDTGEDLPHNNIPPYITVYLWKRVS